MSHGSTAIKSTAHCPLSRYAWANGTMRTNRNGKTHSTQETIVVFRKCCAHTREWKWDTKCSLVLFYSHTPMLWFDVYSTAGVHITISRTKYSTNMVIICVSPYWLCVPYSRMLSLLLWLIRLAFGSPYAIVQHRAYKAKWTKNKIKYPNEWCAVEQHFQHHRS